MTNGDRLRQMTDDELAHFLAKVEALLYRDDFDIVAYQADKVADNLKWIKRDAY